MGIILAFILGYSNTLAKENSDLILTEKEKTYLIEHVGHTSAEIDLLPIEVAKQLVKDKTIKKASGSEIKVFNEGLSSPFTTLGSISPSTMTMGGTVYEVTTDKSGNEKYYIYGNFKWFTSPAFTFVDKMTIGFPSSSGLYLPTSGCKITQHQHRYSPDQQGNGNWKDYSIDYSPSDWEPNAGVAGDFDLFASTEKTLHKGFIGQYVYVPYTANGTINIKLEYGHKRVSGVPSVSVFPAGLSISPSSTVDTKSYALTLSY